MREWQVVDDDGKVHVIVRGLERNSCADGHFKYDTFPPFKDFWHFPKNANIAKVEGWICDNCGFNKGDLPSPYAGKLTRSVGGKVRDCCTLCYTAIVQPESEPELYI